MPESIRPIPCVALRLPTGVVTAARQMHLNRMGFVGRLADAAARSQPAMSLVLDISLLLYHLQALPYTPKQLPALHLPETGMFLGKIRMSPASKRIAT